MIENIVKEESCSGPGRLATVEPTQHAVIDEFLCMVAADGCALGTDVCHGMFKQKSTS